MLGTIAGNSPGNNLASLRDEIAEGLGILVIDLQFTIHTEATYLAPLKRSSLALYHHIRSPFSRIMPAWLDLG